MAAATRAMKHFENLLTVFLSMLAGAAIIELVIFPLYLDAMPSNVASLNGRFGQQLAQSSKAGVVPNDYIMITGDSYSVGLGDALRAAAPGSRAPYASAHFIAQRLGRDVLSIGNPGWSTVSAALAPALFAEQARASWRYPIPAPGAILYYFYEGNDLYDNLAWARLRHGADFSARLATADEIAALLEAERRSDAAFGRRLSRFVEANVPATLFAAGVARQLLWPVQRRDVGFRAIRPAGRINRVVVGAVPRDLPDRMMDPSLLLSDIEWANAILAAKVALQSMAGAYPGVPIAIVYLPSPLSSYDLASEEISIPKRPSPPGSREAIVVPAGRLPENQRQMRRDICEIARGLGYGFIDATAALRAAGRRNFVHGPVDWDHYNLDGYRILGNVVADGLAKGTHLEPPTACEPAAP